MFEQRLLIVTGLSGAGKTQAMHALEDLGFFCVDNLPPALLPTFIELCAQSRQEINKIALVVDIRGGEFFDDLFAVLDHLAARGLRYEILFLEASDDALVRRYKETRRRHPMSSEGEILAGIKAERERLQELRGRAHRVIDTTGLSVAQLKEEMAILYGSTNSTSFHVIIVSFGYKYGLPLDSDLVFDVRFLPNPHYDPALRPLTGNDLPVQEFVCRSPVSAEFMTRFWALIDFLLPNYAREGKSTVVIAIGCTGGVHRSVTIANRLAEHLRQAGYRVTVRHRDLKRGLPHESEGERG